MVTCGGYYWLVTNTIPHHSLPGMMVDQFDSYHLRLDLVVVDVVVLKCIQTQCPPPDGYTKTTALNLFDPTNVRSFNYYLAVKRQLQQESNRMLVDMRFSPFENVGDEFEVVSESLPGLTLYKLYAVADAASENVKLVHDLDVVYGSRDFKDYRPFHKTLSVPSFSRADLEEAKKQGMNGVMPFISLLRLTASEKSTFSHKLADFSKLRDRHEILAAGSKFRVLQLSDGHFGINLGRCVDDRCKSDLKTIKFIDEVIASEKPELVVITGDWFDLARSPDYKLVIIKLLHPILKHQVPFVFTFGDSDVVDSDANALHKFKWLVVNFLLTLPNCYNLPPRADGIYGVTNYNLNIATNDGVKAVVTILDSEDNRLDNTQMYYLHQQNLDHESNLLKLLFFNYPLPQYRPQGSFLVLGEYRQKGELSNKTDPKFYDDIVDLGYHAVLVGHEHENDVCINSDEKMWLCYSSVAGDSASTADEFKRRVRVFDFNFPKQQILTWKRREGDGERHDPQVIHAVE